MSRRTHEERDLRGTMRDSIFDRMYTRDAAISRVLTTTLYFKRRALCVVSFFLSFFSFSRSVHYRVVIIISRSIEVWIEWRAFLRRCIVLTRAFVRCQSVLWVWPDTLFFPFSCCCLDLGVFDLLLEPLKRSREELLSVETKVRVCLFLGFACHPIDIRKP